MSGPFKMKGSPMARNFGIGASPVRDDKFADKKTESKKADEDNARDDAHTDTLGTPSAPDVAKAKKKTEVKGSVAIGTERVSSDSPGPGWTKTKGTNIWTYNG